MTSEFLASTDHATGEATGLEGPDSLLEVEVLYLKLDRSFFNRSADASRDEHE